MIREEIRSAPVRAHLAVQRRELRRAAEPLFDRGRPAQYDDLWRNEIDLPIEPVLAADGQFIVAWPTILRRPAFHAVCQKDAVTRQPNPAQHLIDEPPGSTDERATLGVFGRAGGLADEHHAC